jgi:hypothetical protein
MFYEVKRQSKDIDLSLLEQRAKDFLVATRQLKRYAISHYGLSMQDM